MVFTLAGGTLGFDVLAGYFGSTLTLSQPNIEMTTHPFSIWLKLQTTTYCLSRIYYAFLLFY